MRLATMWGLLVTMGCVLGAQSLPEDPVIKARLQRSQAQGIDEADLPAVPQRVLEPPPLPPPEVHAKDIPHARISKADRRRAARAARSGRRAKGAPVEDGNAPATRPTRRVKAGRATGETGQTARHARPAGRAGRKSGKRVKA